MQIYGIFVCRFLDPRLKYNTTKKSISLYFFAKFSTLMSTFLLRKEGGVYDRESDGNGRKRTFGQHRVQAAKSAAND
ncbi:hypothetical protein BBO01nite_13310 [Brevibacillus borstelensis]|nr:hypothetical protein BBO01nite_13310 [Brevibacillus borstelensis]